jgi:outer membrane protein assembly factor BamB
VQKTRAKGVGQSDTFLLNEHSYFIFFSILGKNQRFKFYYMGRFIMFLAAFILTFSACTAETNDPSQWRGPNREGIYYESGLLDSWPEKGPELLWSFEGLGAGHTSPAIGLNRIFVTGMPDTLGVLYAFDMDGNLLWQETYGTEWHVNYTGPRSTPVIAGDHVYLESGLGVVYCFDAESGNIIWEVDLLKRFDAQNIQWGMTESLLVDGNNIICTPGGEKHNVAALNRFTGETVWTSPGYGEPAAYCSPVLVEHNNTRLIVTMTATSIIGVDAGTGEMYWRAEQMQRNKIHANTPVYSEGMIFCSSASAPENSGTLALRLSDDGKQVEQLWRNASLQNLMGGIVLLNGYIFGSTYRSKNWYAVDISNGKDTLLTKDFTNGVVVYADSLFYLYNEAGDVALVEMDHETFEIRGKFSVPLGTGEHWAHPVIWNKRLYIRHGDALMVYDVAESRGHRA